MQRWVFLVIANRCTPVGKLLPHRTIQQDVSPLVMRLVLSKVHENKKVTPTLRYLSYLFKDRAYPSSAALSTIGRRNTKWQNWFSLCETMLAMLPTDTWTLPHVWLCLCVCVYCFVGVCLFSSAVFRVRALITTDIKIVTDLYHNIIIYLKGWF